MMIATESQCYLGEATLIIFICAGHDDDRAGCDLGAAVIGDVWELGWGFVVVWKVGDVILAILLFGEIK